MKGIDGVGYGKPSASPIRFVGGNGILSSPRGIRCGVPAENDYSIYYVCQ